METDFLDMQTPVGILRLMAGKKGLRSVAWKKRLEKRRSNNLILRQAAAELLDYFNGNLRHFTVRLDLEGAPFHRKIWRVCARILWGRTITYGELARRAGAPRAARAAGTAMAKNPLPIFIPCHRVVAAGGKEGGYSGGGGLKTKRLLLHREEKR